MREGVQRSLIVTPPGLLLHMQAVSWTGPDGMTPLHWASRGGHTHCVAELVGAGALVDCATPTGLR